MIVNGCGVISIPDNLKKTFYELLIKFYETNYMKHIKEFVYKNCVDGFKF